MTVEDCYQLGYIVKPHGLKGEVQIFLDVDDPQQYQGLESVFVLEGQSLVPFFLESISVSSNKALVKFEEIEDIEAAQELKGLELFMPLATLPELEDERVYLHELEGFQINDQTKGKIGQVVGVIDAGGQRLLSLQHESGKEVLVPFTEELVIKFDKPTKTVLMNLPEGLLELYLNES